MSLGGEPQQENPVAVRFMPQGVVKPTTRAKSASQPQSQSHTLTPTLKLPMLFNIIQPCIPTPGARECRLMGPAADFQVSCRAGYIDGCSVCCASTARADGCSAPRPGPSQHLDVVTEIRGFGPRKNHRGSSEGTWMLRRYNMATAARPLAADLGNNGRMAIMPDHDLHLQKYPHVHARDCRIPRQAYNRYRSLWSTHSRRWTLRSTAKLSRCAWRFRLPFRIHPGVGAMAGRRPAVALAGATAWAALEDGGPTDV